MEGREGVERGEKIDGKRGLPEEERERKKNKGKEGERRRVKT